MEIETSLERAILPAEIERVLKQARSVTVTGSVDELGAMACGAATESSATVSYKLPDGRQVVEAVVVERWTGDK